MHFLPSLAICHSGDRSAWNTRDNKMGRRFSWECRSPSFELRQSCNYCRKQFSLRWSLWYGSGCWTQWFCQAGWVPVSVFRLSGIRAHKTKDDGTSAL